MPSLGADMEAGILRSWKTAPGQSVKRGDIVAEVETQKGILDIEVFDSGTVGELKVKVNERVPVGTLLMTILTETTTAEKTTTEPEEKIEAQTQAATALVHRIKASPLARRIAEELGIILEKVSGSGPDGAITRADVESAAHAQSQPPSMRDAIAAAMSRSNREIPHYFLWAKVEMKNFLEHLHQLNAERPVQKRLLPAALLIRFLGRSLKEFPDLNATWEERLIRQPSVNIGLVTSLPTGGLVIPAIHHADQISVDEVMEQLTDVVLRARSGHLRSSDLMDSTASMTNLSEGPSESILGIIYPPQVALIGFGAIREEVVAENGMIAARPVMTITLAADHRATDGTYGNRFLAHLTGQISNPVIP